MLSCKYAIECIINSVVFYLKKTYYMSYRNEKENSSNFFLITVNENPLDLKI